GEHANLARIIHGGVGSPPRARGTPAPFPGRVPGRGITPACAGNTGTRRASTPRRPDHPRVRGARRCSHGPVSDVQGSPPRARGTHDEIPSGRGCRGITPACAGNTARPACARSIAPDHPRVRGEHAELATEFERPAGSPPRARGTHF